MKLITSSVESASVSAGTKLDSQTSSYTSSNYFMALAAEHLDAKSIALSGNAYTSANANSSD